MSPDIEARLRDHVADILAGGGVPAADRADLAEELYGHLAERLAAHRADGHSETDAATLAIADFGGAERIAQEFGRVYHSRLWASTIGALLPAVATRGDRPAVVGWLRFTVALAFVVGLIGLASMVWLSTPMRAVLSLLLIGPALVVLVLAFRALALGQRWALWYAMGVCVSLLVWGVESVINPDVPGSFTIPLGAILAVGVLLGVNAAWGKLEAFVARSRPIGRWLAIGLVATLLTTGVVPPVLGALPDPTQATADDLELRVAMTCDRGDVTERVYPPLVDVQRITLVAEATWRRADILPMGLFGATNPHRIGDTAGLRIIDGATDPEDPDWTPIPNDAPVVDVTTGELVGWWGSDYPSVELVPDTMDLYTVGFESAAIHAGRTLRAEWLLTPASAAGAEWPTVEVSYAHLDRFLVQAVAVCGETVTGQRVPAS